MKSFRATIIAVLMVFAIAGGAMASDLTYMSSRGEFFENTTQLDETFTDSLLFHDFDGSYYTYTTMTNIYSGVRFTAPTDFQFQGTRFYVGNPGTVNTVRVAVYTNNNGQPGTLLSTIWNDVVPTSVTGGWVECVLDTADYLDFDAGDDFWVVIGPQPGNGTDEWSLAFDQDGPEPGDRNKLSFGATASPTNLNYDNDGDFIVVVGGEILGGFFDLVGISIYNDIQRFQFDADSVVTFSAKVSNIGNQVSPAGSATFTVTDSDDNEVFTNTVTFDAVGGSSADTTVVTASETWTPTANGRYIASVEFSADEEESNEENNSYLLLQDVVDHGDWLVYDDGDYESNVTNQAGSGWAVTFHPLAYPAKIDSMTWHFPEAGTAVLRVYTLDSFGWTLAWERNGAVVTGANTFQIDDETLPNGINIAEGEFIGAYMMTGDLAFTADSNPPTSASNPDMPDASYSILNDGLYLDISGNWAIQAKVIEGTPPARIQFALPADPVMFGDVAIGETTTMYYHFANEGDLDGTINSVTFQGSQYDPNEFTCTNTFPMTVAANSADSLELVWTPGEASPGLSVGMFIEHNDPVIATPHVVGVMGNALGVDVISTDAIPDNYFLAQNHPNPFNPETRIQFGLPNAGHVRLTVYNVMGQEVARLVDGQMTAGTFAVSLDGSSLSSGIYFYSLEAEGFRTMKKMSLMK